MTYELHLGDCLEVMKTLPDNSADAVITDPPYGTTACKWDSVIPFEPMWKELKRIAKPKAAICLFGSQPFTSQLIASNVAQFRHQWYWDKKRAGSFVQAKRMPLRHVEDIAVFGCDGNPNYFPQMVDRPTAKVGGSWSKGEALPNRSIDNQWRKTYTQWYPKSIIPLMMSSTESGHHPTQKPVDLMSYLVRTYTQEGETILDFTMGSGTTGVACQLENRNFIGIEKDAGYFEIAKERIEAVKQQEPLFVQTA